MTNPSLRLLYASNAFWASSGYGVQGRSLLPRLAELPEFGGQPSSLEGRENIAQFAWWGLEGGLHHVDGFRIYPKFEDPYGNDVIGAHTRHFAANIVISLIDIWVMHHTAQSVAPALFCPWLPIDCDPVPDEVLNSLQGAHLPLTYSKWGHQLLTRAGFENAYIPHGVESSIYKVLEDRERVAAFKRDLTGIDNAFLCVMISANKGFPSRKWFEGQLEAFAHLAKDVPEARLYVHSLPTIHHGGVDFRRLAVLLGLEGKLIFPNPYIYRLGYPAEHLALVLNAADVFLGASMSEGFGIPLIEAQACGTPVITTNFSAMPELVRWGHLVDVADKILIGLHSYQVWPSKASMLDKLRRVYEAWEIAGGDWPLAKRRATSAAIHAEYDWDTIVAEQWRPLVARLAEEAPPLNPPVQSPGVDAAPLQDEVSAFVEAVNAEAVNAEAEKPEPPRKRVAPLVPRVSATNTTPQGGMTNGNGARHLAEANGADLSAVPDLVGVGAYEAVSDEELHL